MLEGFIVGLGVCLVVGQLYKLAGAPKPDGATLQVLWHDLSSIAVEVVGSLPPGCVFVPWSERQRRATRRARWTRPEEQRSC